MTLIRLFTPGGAQGDGFDLSNGATILIGRAPDVDARRVKEALSDPAARPERVPVASASVSANHAIVEAVGDRIVVTDLSSRNGTWVRVPGARRLQVEVDGELQLRLGEPNGAGDLDGEEFPHLRWTGPEDFANAVAELAHGWLARTVDAAEVRIVDDDAPVAPGAVRIPLPDAQALDVRIHRTTDVDWPRRMTKLWNYIADQVRVFEAETTTRSDGMILASDAIRLAHRVVLDAAARGQRLMLLGPSGSGKELLARAYHQHSNRSGPFIAINCAELDDRIRAELFGTEPGAFTDAVKRAGAIEAANGGTLFLDEIGELSLEVQATLLRFLDRGEFSRTGDLGKTRKADVRVVCATNRDLREEVRQNRFRLDLWFRLASFVVEVPPLHQRPDDLVAYLRARRHPGADSTWAALAPDAQDTVKHHRWDGRWGGNFRELENFAARLPDASGPGSIDAAACRRAIEAGAIAAQPRTSLDPVHASVRESWDAMAASAARRAAETYAEDHGTAPADWNAVKDYIENHLKPVLFAQLAGVAEATSMDALREASKLGADRATRIKQLERYFERFASAGRRDPAE